MNRRKISFTTIPALVALLTAGPLPSPSSLAAPPASFDPARSDPRAIAIVDLALAALGDRRAWDDCKVLLFTFVVVRGDREMLRRTHLWDRPGGRLRFETRDGSGRPIVVLLDLRTRQGTVYREGERVDPERARALLQEAYDAWRNDSRWLLMPYQLKAPGVTLQYGGERRNGGAVHDVVRVTLDEDGAGPGKTYTAYINRATRRLDRWSYRSWDGGADGAPTVWKWRNWQRRGGLLFALEKVTTHGGTTSRILHPLIEVDPDVPERAFLIPDPLPGLPPP